MKVIKASLEQAGAYYIVPADQVQAVIDELRIWAQEGAVGEAFRLELGQMTPAELDALPEFEGW